MKLLKLEPIEGFRQEEVTINLDYIKKIFKNVVYLDNTYGVPITKHEYNYILNYGKATTVQQTNY